MASLRTHLLTLAALLMAAQPLHALDLGKDIERGLGEMVSKELENTYGVADDPLLTDWVDQLGQKLASVSGRTDVKYRFRVLNSDDVNAVAAPGGFVYVNKGTLQFVRSEDELATVLGHEVGHVAGKHAMKQAGAQIVGLLALAGFQAVHANTLSEIGSVAGGLAMLKFGRDEENDADRRGLKNAVAAGYDGRAMTAFFHRLEATEKSKPSRLEVYFLTHPPTEERIRRITDEPGFQASAANASTLAAGYAGRSLFAQAAATYREQLKLTPNDPDARQQLADLGRRPVERVASAPLSPEARSAAQAQLAQASQQVAAARTALAAVDARLTAAEKETGEALEATARSLSNVGSLYRRDAFQDREFSNMARSFNRAVRVSANLRAVQENGSETLDLLARLSDELRQAAGRGDANAAAVANRLDARLPGWLADLNAALKRVGDKCGDVKDGARSLQQASSSLEDSLRSRFGYTSGQLDILDLHATSADVGIRDADDAARKSLDTASRVRVQALAARMDLLAGGLAAGDPGTNGLLAHYLTVESDVVGSVRGRLGTGDAAIVIAARRMQPGKKDKPARDALDLTRASVEDAWKVKNLHWDDAAILLNLAMLDMDRERAARAQ